MSSTTALSRFFDLKSWGKFGIPHKYGESIWGVSFYGREESKLDNNRDTPLSRFGIYRRHRGTKKQIVVKNRYYIPYNPKTATQQNNRIKFADGMAEWQSLTDNQKEVYNTEAKRLKLHGVNLFMREYLRSN